MSIIIHFGAFFGGKKIRKSRLSNFFTTLKLLMFVLLKVIRVFQTYNDICYDQLSDLHVLALCYIKWIAYKTTCVKCNGGRVFTIITFENY